MDERLGTPPSAQTPAPAETPDPAHTPDPYAYPSAYAPPVYGYGSAYGSPAYGSPSYSPPLYPPPPGTPMPSGAYPAPRRRGWAVGVLALVAAAAVAGAGVEYAVNRPSSTVAGSGSTSSTTGNGSGNGSGNGGGGTQTSQGSASASQQIGVVDIDTQLKYQQAEAAGTGMIVTSNGEILTNNHVVDGATGISVTVVSTGKSYQAKVVGTDPTEDIAVLQLVGASGLQTAALGNSSGANSGDAVTGVGNAGGVGGTPSAATGQIVALNQTITASDENGANSETLDGLIETNAPIQAGDSGGPLYNSNGKIIGIDTAASVGGRMSFGSTSQTATRAYAIPINNALSLAKQIESGVETSTIHIGYPPFLGVSMSSSTSASAVVQQVIEGTPAATAGIVAGDTITSIGGTSITSAAGVKQALATNRPGQKVTVGWTDNGGGHHSATVTLVQGPAD